MAMQQMGTQMGTAQMVVLQAAMGMIMVRKQLALMSKKTMDPVTGTQKMEFQMGMMLAAKAQLLSW